MERKALNLRPVNFTIDPRVLKALDRYCADMNEPRSPVVRRLLVELLVAKGYLEQKGKGRHE